MMTLNELRRHGYMMAIIGHCIELFNIIIMIHLEPSTLFKWLITFSASPSIDTEVDHHYIC